MNRRDLDAVVAAPEHHHVALENDLVRVLETRIEPGETVRLHEHGSPADLYVVSWSDFIRRDQEGEKTLDTRQAGIAVEPGSSVWSPPLEPHTLENVGNQTLHVITVEIKLPPA